MINQLPAQQQQVFNPAFNPVTWLPLPALTQDDIDGLRKVIQIVTNVATMADVDVVKLKFENARLEARVAKLEETLRAVTRAASEPLIAGAPVEKK